MEQLEGVGGNERGLNMQLRSGRPFYPSDPRPDEVTIEDIAHSLSMQCRFGGHTRSFYSVAQHSVIVSWMVPGRMALLGLMHDAAEAYVGDLIRPLKYQMPKFAELEAKVWAAIAAKWDLPLELPPAIKHADMVACATEKRDLMAPSVGVNWGVLPDPLPNSICPVPPATAEAMFMQRYEELWG